MQVRRAVPADGSAYLELVRALAEFEKLTPPDQAACERLLQDAFADVPRYELWVGELLPGDVAAYAVTFTTYSTFRARPTLYLEDMFVHPRARRRGMGTRIMEFLKAEALARGCGRFEWTVLDWNTGARELYAKLGATDRREWVLMRIDLG